MLEEICRKKDSSIVKLKQEIFDLESKVMFTFHPSSIGQLASLLAILSYNAVALYFCLSYIIPEISDVMLKLW